MKIVASTVLALFFGLCAFGLDSGTYRLLSVSHSSKLILVSQPDTKARYLLDASNAKITLNGKPLEFDDLENYVRIQVKFDQRKSSKDGIEVDGTASEILVTAPEDSK